jgi:uncharacterized membrane protein
MSGASATATPETRPLSLELRSWGQLGVLGACFLACLALIPLEIDSLFGLPAHPLLVHAPVVFDPLLVLLTLVLAVRADLRRRFGLAWGAFAVLCLLATVLAAGAGDAFFDGRTTIEAVLREHQEAGETLRLLCVGLTLSILVTIAVDRLSATGRGPSIVRARSAAIALSLIVAVLAAGTGFYTVRAGHLGAKAAWSRDEAREGGEGFPATPP